MAMGFEELFKGLILALTVHQIVKGTNIRIGNLGLMGETLETLIYDFAMEKLRQDKIFDEEFTVEYFYKRGCSRENGTLIHHNDAGHAVELYYEHHVNVIIDSGCSAGAEPVAKLLAYWDIPFMGHLSTAEIYADKKIFPTFPRVSIAMDELSIALAEFIVHYKWDRIALVTNSRDPFSQAGRFRDGVQRIFKNRKIQISSDFALSDPEFGYDETLDKIKESARIIVLGIDSNFGGEKTTKFLLEAHAHNMTGPEYVYFVPFMLKTAVTVSLPWEQNGQRNDTIFAAYQRVFVHVAEGTDDALLDSFFKILEKRKVATGINETIPARFDAYYSYGFAIKECMADRECNWKSGRDIFRKLNHQNFTETKCFIGASGNVVLDGRSDRVPAFYVEAVSDSGKLQSYYYMAVKRDNGSQEYYRTVDMIGTYTWGTQDGNPPPAEPKCGFFNERCPVNYTIQIMVGIVGGIILFTVIGFLIYRQRQKAFEASLLAKSWLVHESDLTTLQNAWKSVRHLGSLSDPELMIGSEMAISEKETLMDSEDMSGMFGGVILFKGQKVGMKKFLQAIDEQLLVKNRDDLLMLKSLKELQHQNLNPFYGMCLNSNSKHILVLWNFCSKGSLYDIIFNPEIQLDLTFVSSILKDAVRGLQYLHQSVIGYHGSLTTSNCLVDSRWSVRLTDFGVSKILEDWIEGGLLLGKNLNSSFDSLFHMAPELLINKTSEQAVEIPDPTLCDVYSLGMVIYQTLFREGLFDADFLTPDEILEQLKMRNQANPARPTVPQDSTHDQLIISIMKECWSQDPQKRPSLSTVQRTIHTAYADLTVAEKLKNGLEIPAETFGMVTVFFSDIVGFTQICSRCSPIQIVQMLNKLYSFFDDTIAKYDAYKVETIGDAYLVASGVPNRNGNQHILEIANMALQLRKEVEDFSLPDIPAGMIQIRIGMHSGAVAAGVVGMTMPRYCLFGDTVNVASRMESTGEPMKIQVSAESRELLEQNCEGFYDLKYRGQIMIKGKGLKGTYWLELNSGSSEMEEES